MSQENKTAGPRCKIICNGHLLKVEQNLFDFLKYAMSGEPKSWLGPEDKIWIDAISINQDNLAERSAQVRLMAEIYKAARAVLVWLGNDDHNDDDNDDDNDTQYVVELLKRISDTPKEKMSELKKLQIHHLEFLEVFGRSGGSAERWQSLKKMFSRTWFSRVWIIQEIAFSTSIMVLYGRYSLPWEDCVKACEFLSYSVVGDLQTSRETPFTGSNADILSQFQQSNSNDLLNVLVYTRPFEASDPKDKIFAVLGLATLGATQVPAMEIIRVDYGLTPAEVFLETTWAIIENSKNMNIIAEVEDPRLKNITDAPTWVPDFSSVHRPSIYHQSQALKADGGLKQSLTSLSNRRWLGTAAYRLGDVVASAGLGIAQPFTEYFSKILVLLFDLSPKYITGEDRLEVLWRTMIQNGSEWVSPAPASTAQSFRDWVLVSLAMAANEKVKPAATQECIDTMIAQLETYSESDLTGIMPEHIRGAIKTLQSTLDRNSYEVLESAGKYGQELLYYRHMRIFRTDTGLLGLGQPSLRTANSLWIIPGVSVPMVLQATGPENHFNVVGPAYVYGVMNGEALERDQLELKSIILE